MPVTSSSSSSSASRCRVNQTTVPIRRTMNGRSRRITRDKIKGKTIMITLRTKNSKTMMMGTNRNLSLWRRIIFSTRMRMLAKFLTMKKNRKCLSRFALHRWLPEMRALEPIQFSTIQKASTRGAAEAPLTRQRTKYQIKSEDHESRMTFSDFLMIDGPDRILLVAIEWAQKKYIGEFGYCKDIE